MRRRWSFVRKVAVMLTSVVVLAVVTSAVAAFALRTVVERMETVILVHGQNVLIAQTMATRLEGRASAVRGYLLTGDETFTTRIASARDDFARGLAQLRIQTRRPEDQVLLDEI